MLNHAKWWLLILVASILIVYLMPYSIITTIDEKLDRSEAEQIANTFLLESGYLLKDYYVTVRRDPANFIQAYLNRYVPPERYHQLVNSDTIPNIHWEVQYAKNIPTNQPQTSYVVWVSPRGKIVGFQRQLPDTLTIESLTEEEAARKAQLYLTDRINFSLNNFILRKSQQLKQVNRTD